jgi:hypothetical protein
LVADAGGGGNMMLMVMVMAGRPTIDDSTMTDT